MTLFQHTLKALLRGEKTETSRLALSEPDGETMIGTEALRYPNGIKAVCQGKHMRWTPKWVVGQDYAIQPARGVKSVGRYRIEDIWKQDVRTIEDWQIEAEGFHHFYEFQSAWCLMHDRKAVREAPFMGEGDLREYLANRPTEYYMAWRMSIAVLWDTVNWDDPAVQALQIDHHQELIKALNTPVR